MLLEPCHLEQRCCLEGDRPIFSPLAQSFGGTLWTVCSLRKRIVTQFQITKRMPSGTDDGRPTYMAEAPALCPNAMANVQPDCPLFAILPAEIRLIVFRYALSATYDISRTFYEHTFYFRPGHQCDLKVDISLLLTCRRVYHETAKIPASVNEAYFWYNRSPPCTDQHVQGFLAAKDSWGLRRENIQTLHLFTQQFWLEDGRFAAWTRRIANMQLPRLKALIITFRYSDWWWWENNSPPYLDPKKTGRAQPNGFKLANDDFEKDSWGAQLRNMSGLKVFRLELERFASERKQLDAIVERASGWRFQTADSVMVLEPSRTRRTAWRGCKICKCAKTFDCSSGYSTDTYLSSNSTSRSCGTFLIVDQCSP